MKTFNNQGELTAEISTGLTENGDRITTNTLYDRGQSRDAEHHGPSQRWDC